MQRQRFHKPKQQARLQLSFQNQAELQRQVRDDTAKGLAERIEANSKLGAIIDKQFKAEQATIQARIAGLQNEQNLLGATAERHNEIYQLQTDLIDVEERLNGARSEQLTNTTGLLQEQKEKQDKDTVAISEAAQSYSLQIQKEQKLGQDFIAREGISKAAVSVVQNFQGDLDTIADNDFTYLKDIIEQYNAFLRELPGSVDKGRFTDTEASYMVKVIEPVISELGEIAGPLLRAKLGFRDLIKQFKPLKLAAATLGGIPIIGTAITKKIERQEAGEETLRRAERAKGAEVTRAARRDIEEELSGFTPTTPAESLIEETGKDVKEIKQSVVTDREELFAEKKTPQTAAAEETAEEQANIEEDRFNEQKSLWEMIAENTYESKELLEKLVQEESGIGETVGDMAKGAVGAAGLGGAAVAGKKLLGKKGTETAAKTAGKKVLGKTLLKSAIKKIPVIGAIAGIGFGIGRLMSGDVTGAALEVGSGLASTVPGVGTAASVAADAALAAKDIKNAENEIQQVSESSGVAEVVKPDNMKDIVNIDSKRTIVRTTLETDGLENMLQKMIPSVPQNNTVVAPNNTIQNASNTTVLPKMTNRNLDETIYSLKNVY